MRGNVGVFVSSADRARLAAIVADRNGSQKHVWRAQVVLLTGDRIGANEIMRRTGLGKVSVWRWQERYIDEGVDGLLRDETRPSRVPKLSDETVAEVIRRTQEEAPPDGGTHHAGSWGPRSPTRWPVRAPPRPAGRVSSRDRMKGLLTFHGGGDERVAGPSAASWPRCLRQSDRSPADDRWCT